MSSLQSFQKEAYEILDYSVDYTSELNRVGDTIASSFWTLPSTDTDSSANTSIVLSDSITPDYGTSPSPQYRLGGTSFGGTTATIYIAGGTLGNTYTILNAITTTSNRKYARQFTLQIVRKSY